LIIFLLAKDGAAYYPSVSILPPTQATAAACLRAALRADAAAVRVPGTGLAALILALLVCLLGRTEAAWLLSPEDMADVAPTPHAPHPHGIVIPAIGRAPHAACIEAGLVPDWVLTCIHKRGMDPAANPARPRRRARPARAPPSSTFRAANSVVVPFLL